MKQLRLHWPLYLLIAVAASSLLWPMEDTWLRRLAIGWNLGVALFLGITFIRLIGASSPEAIRSRVQDLDQAGPALLPLAILAALASVVVVVSEGASRPTSGAGLLGGADLALITVVLSWTFIHTMFALRYAHAYYRAPEGGLIFPGDQPPDGPPPDDWDFIHFSFVIGVASQTADIQIADQRLRRLVTCHCLLAFVFNTVVVALAVNFAVTVLGN